VNTKHKTLQTQDEERQLVASAMVRQGGSFVSALGNALYNADLSNTDKIKAAFPEYWEKYLNQAMVEIDLNQEKG